MKSSFTERVRTEAELRDALGYPSAQVLRKTSATLDVYCRRFIERSTVVLVASADASGNMDVSPKGDPPGFVRVLDERTLAIPDRPGNRRADTLRNVLERPRVALLFLVPGRGDTLRVSGGAMVVRDAWLRRDMAVGGKMPALALVVNVAEAFFHCPKFALRSGVWDAAHWPPLDGLASFAQTKVERCGLAASAEEIAAADAQAIFERLY